MPSTLDSVVHLLKKTSAFSNCNPLDFARIVPYLNYVDFKEGEHIFESKMPATELYYVLEGSVKLISEKRTITFKDKGDVQKGSLSGRPVQDTIQNGFIGEEAVIENNIYRSDAIANTDTKTVIIPHDILQRLVKTNPQLKNNLETSLINHYTPHKFVDKVKEVIKGPKKENFATTIGWIFTIIIPALVFYFCNEYKVEWGIDWKTKYFLTILTTTIIMWVFHLVNEYIPSIFAVLAILVLGIAPPVKALSGFTSGSFIMALSIFGFSVILVSSGFTLRIVLYILKYAPNSQFWYSLAILLTGLAITPVFPSANGRIALATPILVDMVESLGYRETGKAATRLTVAMFSGFTMFSAIFLSSKSINFVIYGLLPTQIQDQFDWAYWFKASLAGGVFLLVVYFVASFILFRNKEVPKLSKDQIATQLKILGPMNVTEWAALGSMILFIIGIATSSIHKIKLPWIGFAILFIILTLDFLKKKSFQKNIDWTFLIYLATLISIVTTMTSIGLDKRIASLFVGDSYLAFISKYMTSNFYLFTIVISVAIVIVRFIIPNNATAVIFATVFIPIAVANTINPWIIGFIVIMVSDGWVAPYQSTYYLLFRDLTEKAPVYDKKYMITFSGIIYVARIGAVLFSVWYWEWIGLL